ncbi:hypothetical protein BDV96DRAFT_597437 [Lophiotrema nucula]|uniref:DUF7918 domain-containing protein n=1 Tax=Lophiotrema nucula TaxID=690887 RepID=A0A6A5ZDH4_9PLEO|nr:hypothetical protein BDV96DRAFT_597437 [Lophiotrema nucula]
MAVLPEYPGLKVEIVVDSAPLREYDDIGNAPQSPRTVTKYIETRLQDRKTFQVRVTLTPQFDFQYDLRVVANLDGKLARGCIEQKHHLSHDYAFEVKGVVSQVAGGSYIQQLKEAFSILDEIKVEFYRIKNVRSVPIADTPVHPNTQLSAIPEKEFKGDKALTHQATSQEPERCGDQTRFRYDHVGNGRPFAEFIFKYRSHTRLEALRIITSDESHSHEDGDGVETKPKVKDEPVAGRNKVNMQRAEDGTEKAEDEDEVVFISARSIKGPHLPQEGDEVIELD